jgi:small subunit ribosomal protein S9
MAERLEQFLGTGRRKCAVARVYLRPGRGKLVINGLDWKKYFEGRTGIDVVMRSPLQETGNLTKYDVIVNVRGGGVMGQVVAIRHGVSRALLNVSTGNRPTLKKLGFLTRDPREKERRKYGRLKARKRTQYSKR